MKAYVKIKHARKYEGLTLRELGSIVGLSRATLSNYECGKTIPREKHLSAINKVLSLNLSVTDFEVCEVHCTYEEVQLMSDVKSYVKEVLSEWVTDRQLSRDDVSTVMGCSYCTAVRAVTDPLVNKIPMLEKYGKVTGVNLFEGIQSLSELPVEPVELVFSVDLSRSFWHTLKRYLDGKGISLHQAAKDTGYPFGSFCNWRTGTAQVPIPKIIHMSYVYNVNMLSWLNDLYVKEEHYVK